MHVLTPQPRTALVTAPYLHEPWCNLSPPLQSVRGKTIQHVIDHLAPTGIVHRSSGERMSVYSLNT